MHRRSWVNEAGNTRRSVGTYGMVWYGMVDVCDGYLAAEASGSSFG